VATRYLKRGAVCRVDFEEKEDFRQKIWAVSPFGDFSQKKIGSLRLLENLLNSQV